MNETLEAMARALFKSWFVDFDPVRAKAEGRDPGLPKPLADLFPARLVDSELGEIPEGWEVHTLENVLSELEVGGRPKGGVSGYTEGVPSIGAESIIGTRNLQLRQDEVRAPGVLRRNDQGACEESRRTPLQGWRAPRTV